MSIHYVISGIKCIFGLKYHVMIKQKLIKAREASHLSQAEMAGMLDMSQSQYSRRESGVIRISKKEWDKMARILNTELEDIYEPEDGVYVINYENASGEYAGSHNHFYHMPDHVLDTMKKYIDKLEKEIAHLEEELKRLKK